MSIYNYDDYILYLNDWFKEQKTKSKSFSHQYFADKAGIKSRSFMANILNGSRKLNPKYIFTIAQVIGLKSKESRYFETMVYYNDTAHIEEKNHYYRELQLLKPKTKANRLLAQKYEYFQKWFYPVLREVVCYFDFNGDYKLLGQQLNPIISAVDARKGVDLLIDLDLIRVKQMPEKRGVQKNKQLRLYEQTDTILSTEEELESITVKEFQKATLDLAKKALLQPEKFNSGIFTYTFSLDSIDTEKINALLEEFQEKLIDVVESSKAVDSTHQLN